MKLFCFIQTLFNLTLTFAVHLEKTLFLRFLRSALITYLITLSLEKEIIILEKKSGQSFKFWIQKWTGNNIQHPSSLIHVAS